VKVLMIAPQPFFSPRGTPFSVYYRTLVLAEQGASVDVLTYGEGEDVAIPGARIIRIPRIRALEPVRIGPSAGKAFLDVLMVAWTVRLLAGRQYDVVHAHEEAVIWSRWLKPLFGFGLAYDMHSSLPQQFHNFDFVGKRPVSWLFRRLEQSALRHADATITICPALRDHVREQGVAEARHFLIENSIFEPVRREAPAMAAATNSSANGHARKTEAKSSETRAGVKQILYAGTFEPYQGVELLLRAFARLTDGRGEVQLCLIGGRAEQVAQMRELAASLGIAGCCQFTGALSKEATQTAMEAADVLASPRLRGHNTPMKVYELLASGKPVVATDIYAHTQVLTKEVAFLAAPSPEPFAAAMQQALSNESEAEARPQAAARLYEEAYSRATYEHKMRQFMEVLR
jgi:glycosyltransferase involved in cell wall biosynthesis